MSWRETMGSTATPPSSSSWTTSTRTCNNLQKRNTPAYQQAKRRPLKTPHSSPSSSSWKDTLRRKCLERIRQTKKQEKIWKARQLVQEELKECGVTIQQGMEGVEGSLVVTPDSNMDDATRETEESHAISEAELYELMQEVEEELQRHESRLHEEMQEIELCEQLSRQHLESQIAEYQDWEQAENDASVLCPICKEANLLELPNNGGVACPNNMSGSCLLRIQEPIALPALKERLGTAYDMHACTTCSGSLEFYVQSRGDGDQSSSLVAMCSTCDSNVCIL